VSRYEAMDPMHYSALQLRYVLSLTSSPRYMPLDVNGSPRGPFAPWLERPEIGEAAARLGEELRFHGCLSDVLRELVILTVARHWRAGYQWCAHVRAALAAGVAEMAITAVGAGESVGHHGASEEVLVRCARRLLQNGGVTDDEFTEVTRAVGVAGSVEFTMLVGYYSTIAFTINTFGATYEGTVPWIIE
jgi:4-carboxymuconolactone decarboxylase